ncbi:hypothetical protein GNP76_19165 [Aliivibrio fischeri]|nr:hypothetical protein [Aliivibrio fischeri]MUK71503.1 hypothetical protein [Aliivibrio fischeri]MUK75245.1 hypothetical protein [Aliivibrio fischeri]
MFDDFDIYFYEAVIEPYYDYIGRQNNNEYGRSLDLKLALISATSLFHLREHLPKSCVISRTKFEQICPEYSLIADVVNASKHRKIDRNTPQLSHSKQIIERVVTTIYKDEQGEYSHNDKFVVIILNNGKEVYLHDLLYLTIKAWNSYLQSKGIICENYTISAPKIKSHYSRIECNGLNLSLISGFPFNMEMQLLRYDYQKNKAVPVDLTGSEIKMKVYKPITFELSATDSDSGKSASSSVTLTTEDSRYFNNLDTDEERKGFLESLLYVKHEYIKLYSSLKNT